MSTEELEVLVEKVRALPVDKQREVIDFVEFLATRVDAPQQLKSLEGLLAGCGLDVSPEAIDAARRERGGNVPREDI